MTDEMRTLSPTGRFLVAMAMIGQALADEMPPRTEMRAVCTCCDREPYLCGRTHLGNRCPTKVREVPV